MKNIKNAFSLVEVLILFTIMSVIMAASLPTISRKSNGIPIKLQQGAYYCIANDDANGRWEFDENLYKYVYRNGTYTEMQFAKGNLKYRNPQARSCTFNPPARAAVFKITLIGAGAGGYDYVKVVNDKNNQIKNYYKLGTKYTTKNDTKSFRELGPQELWDAFKGQTIKLCTAIPHGGDGGSAKVSTKVPGKGVCYCGTSPCNNSIEPITEEECNSILGHTDFRTSWESEVLSGGQGGGKGMYITGEYTIPQNPPKGNNKYEENLYLIGALSQYGECASCTPEKAKPTVSGYSVTPSKDVSGKKTNGKDSDYSNTNPYPCREAPSAAPAGGNASGYTYIMLPNQYLTGANVYMSGAPAKGGKGAGIDASSNPITNLNGTFEDKDYISANKFTSFKPQLEFNTNFTRRHYYLGDYGNDGEYLHFLKYSLDGPCQIQVGQGGPAFKGEYELYPSRTDMSTRIVCRGFEKSVQGGAPSIAIQDDQYDQYVYLKKANGDPVDTMSEKRVNSRNLKLTDTSYRTPKQRLDGELFFKLYQPALFNGIGEGGRGAGFVDKCTGKGKDKTDLNRYEGDFTISIGNEYNNSVVKTWKTEKLESNCIDKSQYNQYGTVDGKYEHIDALPGHGGAVIITW